MKGHHNPRPDPIHQMRSGCMASLRSLLRTNAGGPLFLRNVRYCDLYSVRMSYENGQSTFVSSEIKTGDTDADYSCFT